MITHNAPDETVVAGVPARIISTTHDYAEKCLRDMLDNFDKADYLADKKLYLMKKLR